MATTKGSKKAAARKPSRPPKVAPPKPGGKGTHTEHEDHPWTIDIPDHPERQDSKDYLLARKIMRQVAPKDWFLTPKEYQDNSTPQDHHGGGLWLKDEQGWFLVKNLAGMEWSSQFCADPAKVDQLRQNAKRLYGKFPLSAPAFKELGFDLEALLNTPITDANGVARWTDSICNASVPLPAAEHTGILPHGGGVHHYPTPITDIALFKHDDFQLWVKDEEGQPTAVVPTGRRGSGDGKVEVVYATPGTKLQKKMHAAHSAGTRLVLPEQHRLARQAFAQQVAKSTK